MKTTTLLFTLCFALPSLAQKIDTTYLNNQNQEVQKSEATFYKVFTYDKKGKRVTQEQAYSLSNVLLQEINYIKENKSGRYFFKNLSTKRVQIGEFEKDKQAGIWYTNDLEGNNIYFDVYSAPDVFEGRYAEIPYEGEKTDVIPGSNIIIEEPVYPGGMGMWNQFLRENLKYPREASRKKIQGRVGVKFFVKSDGSIENIRVGESSDNSFLDDEALRVVEASKKWVPAQQNGYPIDRDFMIRIIFRLK